MSASELVFFLGWRQTFLSTFHFNPEMLTSGGTRGKVIPSFFFNLINSWSIPHRDSAPPDVQPAQEYRIWENEHHSERQVHHLLIRGNLQTVSPTCLGTIGTPIRVMGEKEEGYSGTESHSRQCWLDGKGYKDLNGWNHVLHRGIQRIGLWRGSAVKAFKGVK